MVKNTHGGNRTKGQARKNFTAPVNTKLRMSENELEVYAIATHMLGNGRFYAKRLSGKLHGTECICVIRGKFKGKKKRNNLVSIGTVVLIGEREWRVDATATVAEHEKKENDTCDLLEVYSETDKNKLCSDNIIKRSDTLIDQQSIALNTKNSDEYMSIQFSTQEQLDAEEYLEVTNDVVNNSSSSCVASKTSITVPTLPGMTAITLDNGGYIDINDI